MSMSIIESVTLGIALVGAVLGVINTVHSLNTTRLKLRVRPFRARPIGSAPRDIQFGIEVINLSAFPVTVREVGVMLGRNKKDGARLIYHDPILLDDGPWPRRLESRQSVTVYGPKPMPPKGKRIRKAFAATECEVLRYGMSPALKQIAKMD